MKRICEFPRAGVEKSMRRRKLSWRQGPFLFRALRAVFVAIAAGCGGSDPAPAPTIAESDFVSTYARAACDGLESCCTAASTPFNRDACVTMASKEAENAIALRSQSSVYDGKQAFTCIETIRSILAPCVQYASTSTAIWDTCKSVRVGTLPAGASCTTDADCAPSEQGTPVCPHPLDTPPGQCTILRPGTLGQPCMTPEHQFCAKDLDCGSAGTCVSRLGEGAVCRRTSNCAETLWCPPPDLGTPQPVMSKCARRTELGGACNLPDQCTSGSCYEGQCVAGLPVAPRACF